MNATRTHTTHHNENPRSSPQLQMVPDIDNKTDTATAIKNLQYTNTFSTLNQLVSIPAAGSDPAGQLMVYGSGGWLCL